MILYNYVIFPIETFYRSIYLLLADWLGNYGLAVVALSLLNFLILYPFTKKAQEVQQEEVQLQGILQKQIEEIKHNYSGAEQFEKIQRLYDRYGYHPVMAIRSIFGLLIQLPFLLAAFYMLSNCSEIQGVSWGIISNLGKPDGLLNGLNILPFLMTFVSVLYAFFMPDFDRKQRFQTVIVSVLFLFLLYSAPSALLIFWTCNIFWSLLNSVFSKKLQWISCLIKENELAFHIIFALTLTVGIFVPFEVYIKNAGQLWFGVKDIVKFFLLETLQCFGVFCLAYIICWRKKVRCFYLSILLGVLFGVFLQSYIVGMDYGLFDGHEIKWEEYTWQGIVNTFIWFVCLVGSFEFFRRLQFDKERIKKFIKPVIFGIVSVQCVVLAITFIQNPLPGSAFQRKDSINVLTTKDMFTISSKENIIIFLLDAFDAKIFEEIIAKEPEFIKELSGFTFYPDTTSVYGYTDYSLPQILTGKIYYNDRPYIEYFEEAWKETPYYNYLLDKNYDICIYTAGNLVSKTAPISNLISEKTVLNDESMRSFNNLARFRMVPHCVKKSFYDYDPNAWMRLLANPNDQVYKEDDRQFYLNLKKGLFYRDVKNSFHFYHLAGAHYPFVLNRNMEPVSKNANRSQYEQSVGVLKIVLEFIVQMKHRGVFDDSTFVIMADHGEHNEVGSRPLLCIKYPNSSNTIMKVSDDSISYAQFLPMLFQKKERVSLNRSFFVMDRKNLVEYQISGKAKDIKSWRKVGVLEGVYSRRSSLYTLGEEIVFNLENQSAERFQLCGWDRMEPYGVWSLGSNAELQFRIQDYRKKDLQFQFIASAYLANLPHRNVNVYVNGKFISKLVFNNSDSLFSFIIPSSVINDNLINIRFSIDHPGISLVREGKRDLGIFLQRLRIKEIN